MISVKDDQFISAACNLAMQSNMLQRHGCVAVVNGKIVGEGYNNYRNYSKDGMQNVASYELCNIKNSQLTLIDKAIWKKSEKKKFYFSKNKYNVSLSFSNFDNNYRSDTEYIYVNTLSYNEIINDFNLKSLSLIKLDIEGSELEVIKSILNSKILPDQILVEFDELHTYRLNEIKKYYRLHTLLAEKGYVSIKINEFSNQLYIKKNLL